MVELQFVNNTISYNSDDIFAAHLSRVNGTDQLLHQISIKLKFPDYFGFNWNALYDCLRDFDWIEQREIMLIHDELPILSNADMRIYLDILVDAVKDWKNGEKHSLKVFFMERDRSLLDKYL